MQAVHDRLPPSGKSLGNRPFDLTHQPRSSNGNLAVRFNEPREVAQIKIVSSEIGERVYRNYGIKKVVSKGKCPCFGVDWVNAMLDIGIANSLQVFGRAGPQVHGPHLDFEFLPQKYRRQSAS